MRLIPVKQFIEDNIELNAFSEYKEMLQISVDHYKQIGFNPPWIGYFAEESNHLIGCGGFKGEPVNGKVEIAYYTFPDYENKGTGTEICKMLVEIARSADPSVIITARTLPEKNSSGSILLKNDFRLAGPVNDDEDGQVWEWVYTN